MRADIINCEQIIPRKLYKYYSVNDNLFNLIRNHSCWFSKPSDFNDPFDCNLDISIGRNPKEIMHNMDKSSMLRLLYDALSQKGDDVIDAGARIIKKPFLLKNIINEIHKYYIDQNIGVFCLSQDPANILMWSHYADSGKGMRITFDMPEAGDDSPYYVREVKYEDKIPEFDCRCMKELFKGAEIVDYLDRLSYTKGSAWSYENEVRMFVPSNLAERDWNGRKYLLKRQSKEGREIDMLRLGHYYTRRVDLGPRVNPDCAQRLIDELRTVDETRHIAFWQAKLTPGAYAYTYRKVF